MQLLNRKVRPRSHAARGNAVKARCAASHGQYIEMHIVQIRDAARPALRSHAARGNEGKRDAGASPAS